MTMSLTQETSAALPAISDLPLRGVRPNIVQSIRAFRVPELQDAARSLGHHFLYASLADAQTKQDVLDLIGHQFMLSLHVGKNFDALYDSMTDPLHLSLIHISEPTRQAEISYAVFCLKKKKK